MVTFKGRVVYRRQLHPFRYTDVLRIVRKVRPRAATKQLRETTREGLAIVGTILAADADFLDFLGVHGLEILPQQQLVQLLQNVFAFAMQVLSQSPLWVQAAVSAEGYGAGGRGTITLEEKEG